MLIPCAMMALMMLATAAVAAVPAFPGAEGYGKWAKGGRGGKVCFVTNLRDGGPGSLRAACEAEGPRTVIFRVSGTITLETPVRIAHPYLTIAGQTAPGGGICIRTERWRGDKGALEIATHDVILRHLRIRTAPPPPPAPGDDPHRYAWIDPIFIRGKDAHDIIIDHVSASWGSKDAMRSWWGPHDVTIQHCILSEGITSQGHSKGALVGGGSDRFTFYRNLFAHNQGRNPYIKGGDSDAADTVATYQVINNVIYDWGSLATEIGVDDSPYWSPSPGHTRTNVVGNYFKPGPSTAEGRHEITVGKAGTVRVYVADTIGPHRPNGCGNDWSVVDLRWLGTDRMAPPGVPAPPEVFRSAEPFDSPPLPVAPAHDAYLAVLLGAGATMPQRDPIDARVVSQVSAGTGRLIADPSEVGGWPELAEGTPYPDEDGDGMDDRWERSRFGSLDRDGRQDADGDGYTDLDDFLNSLIPPAGAGEPSTGVQE